MISKSSEQTRSSVARRPIAVLPINRRQLLLGLVLSLMFASSSLLTSDRTGAVLVLSAATLFIWALSAHAPRMSVSALAPVVGAIAIFTIASPLIGSYAYDASYERPVWNLLLPGRYLFVLFMVYVLSGVRRSDLRGAMLVCGTVFAALLVASEAGLISIVAYGLSGPAGALIIAAVLWPRTRKFQVVLLSATVFCLGGFISGMLAVVLTVIFSVWRTAGKFLALIILFAPIFVGMLPDLFVPADKFVNDNNAIRAAMWSFAVNKILDSPLFGVGLFFPYFPSRVDLLNIEWLLSDTFRFSNHSSVLDLVYRFGIVGFAFLSILIKRYSARIEASNIPAISILVPAIAYNPLLEDVSSMTFAALLLGMLESRERSSNDLSTGIVSNPISLRAGAN